MVQLTSPTSSRKPYDGTQDTVLIAIDVGTTFSGVSYAILRPGEIPTIHGVTSFPDQEHVVGDRKVPSVMYYDEAGEVRAAGASTENQNVIDEAEDEGWIKVEYFKLHLRPANMELNTNELLNLCHLPPLKSAIEVLGDFLLYLTRQTVSFIKKTHVHGPALWSSVEDHVEFVLSHPNGWGGQQQQKMRQSAVYGGLIPDTPEGHSRLRFVTEGEASLHACLTCGSGPGELKSGDAFIIVDAGGGTLDISSYEIESTNPLRVQELTSTDCRFAGSIFVNGKARLMLEDKLRGSKYDDVNSLDSIVKEFDRSTKRIFGDSSKPSWVTVGGVGEKDPALGIRGGKLKLNGIDVAKCFQFSVEEAIDSIKKQKQASRRSKMDIWLVGGFASSPWLPTQLKDKLQPLGFSIYQPDTHTSKAVADGAIGFYLDHWVTTRVSKVSCGIECLTAFQHSNPDHRKRQSSAFRGLSGQLKVDKKFICFISEGTMVSETTTYSKSFAREVRSLTAATSFVHEILSYTGPLPVPSWTDESPNNFKPLCVIQADLSAQCLSSNKLVCEKKAFWKLHFDVEIMFGLTEFKARIKWIENGSVKYGPASIIYEDIH